MNYIITVTFVILTCILVWYFVKHDKGPKEPIKAVLNAFGFGILSFLLAAYLDIKLVGYGSLYSDSLIYLLYSSLAIGFIEEVIKVIPFSLYIYKKDYFNEHMDGIIYYAICGLTFGLIENIMYTLIYGSQIGIIRLILLPIFHGSTTAVVGYFIARKKIKKESFKYIVLVLIGISLIHGLYNFGISYSSVIFFISSFVLSVLPSVLLLILYRRAKRNDDLR